MDSEPTKNVAVCAVIVIVLKSDTASSNQGDVSSESFEEWNAVVRCT